MYLAVLANRMLINANYVLCDTKVKITYRVSFLVKSNCRWSIKSISGTPPGEVEDFPISRMFEKRTKSFNCARMTGIKLNIRAWRWNWDPGLKILHFIKSEKKSIHQERLNYLSRDQNASFSLVPGWCGVQKAVTVFSEKYLKFFTINVFCTQAHWQCI